RVNQTRFDFYENCIELIGTRTPDAFSFSPPQVAPFNRYIVLALISIKHVVALGNELNIPEHDKNDVFVGAREFVNPSGALRINHNSDSLQIPFWERLLQQQRDSVNFLLVNCDDEYG